MNYLKLELENLYPKVVVIWFMMKQERPAMVIDLANQISATWINSIIDSGQLLSVDYTHRFFS